MKINVPGFKEQFLQWTQNAIRYQMKNLVLKIPTFVFSIGVLVPLFLFAYMVINDEPLVETRTFKFFAVISSILKILWLFSIVDYFQSKLDDFKYLKLIYFLLLIDGLLTFSTFLIVDSNDIMIEIALYLLPAVNHIATTVFITLLIQKVFYDRAVWFIVIEIFTLIVGIITLTPEIKRHEKEINNVNELTD